MNVRIKINCDSAAFKYDLAGELKRVLDRVPLKVYEKLGRGIGCLRVGNESAGKLYDADGNAVGELEVEASLEELRGARAAGKGGS